ncbi:hypothetical protein QQF21_12170 [Lelliottia sp. V89_10]|uniref:hypothetical protein n=1 Tax=Lelliottia wanjuensis TaxID=3050585 RepID=UPI00249E4809|nr:MULTISPECIES: hypothetical protein [unclassified Lelliottia]MDI3359344.1 hypothetical protein [Lelliottia sp. V89_13]MDK9549974.1 hypothetical protein [Lelliottia sp. V89_5]MDK9596362.1 hypothetical protein [Lelliottia sp. V89_10]
MITNNENQRVVNDVDWGCSHNELKSSEAMIKTSIIRIDDIMKVAAELTRIVLDKSWMLSLDIRTQRSYRFTVEETAAELVKIFKKITSSATPDNKIGVEFGELMVSMGASRALLKLFDHLSLPIAELWKPQKKQNEGFDFHTVCPNDVINFGEAKYSGGSSNPHGEAISQINDFLDVEKHLRDTNHLVNLVCENACKNLDNDNFGIVAAFSINSDNYDLIMKNAFDSINEKGLLNKCKIVYLVGVMFK